MTTTTRILREGWVCGGEMLYSMKGRGEGLDLLLALLALLLHRKRREMVPAHSSLDFLRIYSEKYRLKNAPSTCGESIELDITRD